MMESMRKYRIGFLWPADGLNDDEFLAFLPEDASWLTTRYDAGTETEELTCAVLSAYADPETLRRAARMLHAVEPDLVACGDHAASFIAGTAGEQGMIDAIEAELGCSAVTMGAAMREALSALDAQCIALVSPYSSDVTDALIGYMEASGITVVACHVAGATRELDIGTRTAEAWRNELIAFVQKLETTPDAVVLAGGGVRFAAAITAFEAQVGLPVVTGPGALVRAALLRLGLPAARPGRGALFRESSAKCITRIAALQSTGTKSFVLSETPPVFISGSGAWLISEDGGSFLDFACGSGTSALGHGHPATLTALQAQLDGGILHLGPHFHSPSQARLYDTLTDLLPASLHRFHPAVSGGEATEVAIKAAMHATGQRHFIGFEGGYHGRSMGALAVSGARGHNSNIGPFAPSCDILPFPFDEATAQTAVAHIQAMHQKLAAVIIEPVQATAGLRIAHHEGLAAIAGAARDMGVALIFDEVFTGFGRTGRLFAFEYFALVPDMLILGKSLGGGLPAGIVAGSTDWLGRWPAGVQTSTFQMHPAAAATAQAFLDVLVREDLPAVAAQIGTSLGQALEPLRQHRAVREIRGLGAFWALEMQSRNDAICVRRNALQRGLLTWECGLHGEVIGLVPPLIVSRSQLQDAVMILDAALGAG